MKISFVGKTGDIKGNIGIITEDNQILTLTAEEIDTLYRASKDAIASGIEYENNKRVLSEYNRLSKSAIVIDKTADSIRTFIQSFIDNSDNCLAVCKESGTLIDLRWCGNYDAAITFQYSGAFSDVFHDDTPAYNIAYDILLENAEIDKDSNIEKLRELSMSELISDILEHL